MLEVLTCQHCIDLEMLGVQPQTFDRASSRGLDGPGGTVGKMRDHQIIFFDIILTLLFISIIMKARSQHISQQWCIAQVAYVSTPNLHKPSLPVISRAEHWEGKAILYVMWASLLIPLQSGPHISL